MTPKTNNQCGRMVRRPNTHNFSCGFFSFDLRRPSLIPFAIPALRSCVATRGASGDADRSSRGGELQAQHLG